MELRHSFFVKTGIRDAMLMDIGSAKESFLIITAGGMLAVLTFDLTSSYRSKPLEFDANEVRSFTAALKPGYQARDLAFSSSVAGIISADLSDDCLYTVNDHLPNATTLAAISMSRLTFTERQILTTLCAKKQALSTVVSPIVLAAQQCNVTGYKVPEHANLTKSQEEAFWVPTGDLVTHVIPLVPLVTVSAEMTVDYVVISRDKYGRYFRSGDLLAEKRLPAHVLRAKTYGRFILLILVTGAMCLWHVGSDAINLLHTYSADKELLDACLIDKPFSNILLDKRPLSMSSSFKGIENKTVESVFSITPAELVPQRHAENMYCGGIPMVVKLYSAKIMFTVLTFHPTSEDRGQPATCELPIYTFVIPLLTTRSVSLGIEARCMLNSGTSAAVPNTTLLWVLANDSISTYSMEHFVDMHKLLQICNFRGFICGSGQGSLGDAAQEVLALMAQKRSLVARAQLLKQKKAEETALIHDISDSDDKADASKEYTFGDLLRETRLLKFLSMKPENLSRVLSLKCLPGHCIATVTLPDQLFLHSIYLMHPQTSVVELSYVPHNFSETATDFFAANKSTGGFSALSLGPLIRDHTLQSSVPLESVKQKLRLLALHNGKDHIDDLLSYSTLLESREASDLLQAELGTVFQVGSSLTLLSVLWPDYLSHHADADQRPASSVNFCLTTVIAEKYAGTTITVQITVSQTRLASAMHGVSVALPLEVPACPMVRIFPYTPESPALFASEASLFDILEKTATLTLNLMTYNISATKLLQIICQGKLTAPPSDLDSFTVETLESGGLHLYMENCSPSPLLNFLFEVSETDLSLSSIFGCSTSDRKAALLGKLFLGNVFKVTYHASGKTLTEIQLTGLDISLLISFAKGIITTLLPGNHDTTSFRTLFTSLSLHSCMRSFLRALQAISNASQEKAAHISAGLSEISARMILDCNQMLDLVSMCSYRHALDQLGVLRNSARITINQALNAQALRSDVAHCEAYIVSLESSLLFANAAKSDVIKAWRYSSGAPESLEWAE